MADEKEYIKLRVPAEALNLAAEMRHEHSDSSEGREMLVYLDFVVNQQQASQQFTNNWFNRKPEVGEYFIGNRKDINKPGQMSWEFYKITAVGTTETTGGLMYSMPYDSDKLHFGARASFPDTGYGAVYYIAEDENKTYRWDTATAKYVPMENDPGDNGWTPTFAIVVDNQRRVLQIIDWAGGTGTKPVVGQYIGASGLTSVLSQAIDIRGPEGGTSGAADAGDKGWSPVFSLIADGERRVLQVSSWIGGEGTPPGTNQFVGASGLVGSAAQAVDIRGAEGQTGTGVAGNSGWTPIFSIVSDSERRVLQVSDWTGGQGTKPTINQYVGLNGFTSTISQAIDIRGAQGEPGPPGGGDATGGGIDYVEDITLNITEVDVEQEVGTFTRAFHINRHEFSRAEFHIWQKHDINSTPVELQLDVKDMRTWEFADTWYVSNSLDEASVFQEDSAYKPCQFHPYNNQVKMDTTVYTVLKLFWATDFILCKAETRYIASNGNAVVFESNGICPVGLTPAYDFHIYPVSMYCNVDIRCISYAVKGISLPAFDYVFPV